MSGNTFGAMGHNAWDMGKAGIASFHHPYRHRSVGWGIDTKENRLSILIDHLGVWTGTWLTFLKPDELFDESPIRASIEHNDDGFVIAYIGSIKGEDVEGRLVWSGNGNVTTVDWVDSWHTGGKHERLEGLGDAAPSYQYGGDEPWTWDISIDATDSGVTVIHHNSGPAIPRYVGVLMKLESRSS